MAVRDSHRNAHLRGFFQRRHVVEHALIVPDNIVLVPMFAEKVVDFPIIAHYIAASPGNCVYLPDFFRFFWARNRAKAAQKIELNAFAVYFSTIRHLMALATIYISDGS